MTLKILWGITGSGDKIEDTVDIMVRLQKKYNLDLRVALSKNAERVARMYEVWEKLERSSRELLVERGPNEPGHFKWGSMTSSWCVQPQQTRLQR